LEKIGAPQRGSVADIFLPPAMIRLRIYKISCEWKLPSNALAGLPSRRAHSRSGSEAARIVDREGVHRKKEKQKKQKKKNQQKKNKPTTT
jgi:hypothetical protein